MSLQPPKTLFLALAFAAMSAPVAHAADPPPDSLGDVAPPGAPDGEVDRRDVEVLLEGVLSDQPPAEDTLLRGDLAPASRAGPEDEVPLRLEPNPVPGAPLDVGDAVLAARRAAGQVVFVARNEAPTVELEGGDRLVPDAELRLRGTVSDDGALDECEVRALADGQPVGWAVRPAADGSFEARVVLDDGTTRLTARATDARGRQGPESDPVVITVDTQAPWLEVEFPEDGLRQRDAEVEVSGRAGDNHGLLEVRVDGEPALLLEDRFGATVALEPGENVIEVVAEDLAGNLAGPILLTVVRDEDPPEVAFDPPDSPVNTETAVLTGTVVEEWGLDRVEVDGVLADVDEEAGRFRVEVPLQEGSNRFVALAVDLAGNRRQSEPVEVVADWQAPGVALASPAWVAASPTVVELSFDEPAVLELLAGQPVPPGQPADGASVAGVALGDGVNHLSYRVVDRAGNVTEGEVVVTLDTTPPAVTITRISSPEPGARFLPEGGVDGVRTNVSTVVVEGEVQDDYGIDRVEVAGRAARLDAEAGAFIATGVRLSPILGANDVAAVAFDRVDHQARHEIVVHSDVLGPAVELAPVEATPFLSTPGPFPRTLDVSGGLQVQGQATDPSGLPIRPVVRAEGVEVGVAGSGAEFRFVLTADLLAAAAGGKLDLEVTHTDGLGNVSTTLVPSVAGRFSAYGAPVQDALGAGVTEEGMVLLESQVEGQMEALGPGDLGGIETSFNVGLTIHLTVQAVTLCAPRSGSAHAARNNVYDCENDVTVDMGLEAQGVRIDIVVSDLFVDLRTRRGRNVLCIEWPWGSDIVKDGWMTSSPTVISTLARFQGGAGGLQIVPVAGSTSVDLRGFSYHFDDGCLSTLAAIGEVFGLSIEGELENAFEDQIDTILGSLAEQLREPLVEFNGLELVISDAAQDARHLELWLEAQGDPCGEAGCGDPPALPGVLLGRSGLQGRVAVQARGPDGSDVPLQVGLDDSFLNLVLQSEWYKGTFDMVVDDAALGGAMQLDTTTLSLLLPDLARPDVAEHVPPGRSVVVSVGAGHPPLSWARDAAGEGGGLDVLLPSLELSFLADLDDVADGVPESEILALRVSARGEAVLVLALQDLHADPPRSADRVTVELAEPVYAGPDPAQDTLRAGITANPYHLPEAQVRTLLETLSGALLAAYAGQTLDLPGSLVRFTRVHNLGPDGRMLAFDGYAVHEVVLDVPISGTVTSDAGLGIQGHAAGLGVQGGRPSVTCHVLVDGRPVDCQVTPVPDPLGGALFAAAGHELLEGDNEVLLMVVDGLNDDVTGYAVATVTYDPDAGGTFPPPGGASCLACATGGGGGVDLAWLLGLLGLALWLGRRRARAGVLLALLLGLGTLMGGCDDDRAAIPGLAVDAGTDAADAGEDAGQEPVGPGEGEGEGSAEGEGEGSAEGEGEDPGEGEGEGEGPAEGEGEGEGPGPDDTPPVLAFTGPVGPVFRPRFAVTGTVADDRGVDGVWLRLGDEDGPRRPELDLEAGTFSLDVELPPGDHPVVAEALDTSGNRAEAEAVLEVRDRLAPELEVLEPGFEVEDEDVVFVVRAEDDFGVAWVALSLPRSGDELPAEEDPDAPGQWRAAARLLPGDNPVLITAEDVAGNLAELAGRVVLRDEVPPVVELTSPEEGATVWTPELLVSGRVTDDRGLDEVVVSIDGEVPPGGRFLPEGEDGAFSQEVPVALGEHTVEVVATDLAGNLGLAGPVRVTRLDPDAVALVRLEVAPRVLLVEPGARALAVVTAERTAGGPVPDGTVVRFSVEPAGLVAVAEAEVGTEGGAASLELTPAGEGGAVTVLAEVGGVVAEAPLTLVLPSLVEVGVCTRGLPTIWGADLMLATTPGAAVELAPPPAGAAGPAVGLDDLVVASGRSLPLRVVAATATPVEEAAEVLVARLPLAGRPAAGPEEFEVVESRLVVDDTAAVRVDRWRSLAVCRADNVAGDLPPVVTLERPPAVVEEAELVVSGRVEDADLAGVVAILVVGGLGRPLELDGEGGFSTVVELVPGPNRLEVEATDAAGGVGRDGFDVTFEPRDDPPEVELLGPPEEVAAAQALVEGLVRDDGDPAAVVVEVLVGEREAVVAPVDEAGAFAVEVALDPGDNLIVVRATDPGGNVGTARRAVRRVEDGGPPTVEIVEPEDGALFEVLPVELEARVEGGATPEVDAVVTVDGEPVEARYSPFSRLVTARLELAPGERTLAVTVTDQLGRSDSAAVTVTYAPPDDPPELVVEAPEEGARVAGAQVRVAGTVADDLGLDGVTVGVVLDGGEPVPAEVRADGGWSVALPVEIGDHEVLVVAADSTGHTAEERRAFAVVPAAVVVLSDMRIGGPADGFNVDEDPETGIGDPDPDNALSALGGLANGPLRTALDDGSVIVLLEFEGLAELPAAGEEVLADVHVYTGLDDDGDPTDNFSGEDEFSIDPSSLDEEGEPLVSFTQVTVRGTDAGTGTFDTEEDGRPGSFSLDVPGDPPIHLEIAPAYVRGELSGEVPDLELAGSDGADGDLALIGGVVPACVLAVPIDMNGMEIVPLQLLAGVIDVDLNGDGELDRQTTTCDGEQENPDGLSVGLLVRGVPARVLR